MNAAFTVAQHDPVAATSLLRSAYSVLTTKQKSVLKQCVEREKGLADSSFARMQRVSMNRAGLRLEAGQIQDVRRRLAAVESETTYLVGAASNNPMLSPEYNKFFQESGGNLPPPKPFYPGAEGRQRYVFVRASIGSTTLTVAAGATSLFAPNPYELDNPIHAYFNGGAAANWDQGTFKINGAAADVTGGSHGKWRVSAPRMYLGSDYTTGAGLDLLGNPAMNAPSSVGSLPPSLQVLGGEFSAQVTTPYNNTCVTSILGHGTADVILGHNSVITTNVANSTTLQPESLQGIIRTPAIDITGQSLGGVTNQYGTVVTQDGSSDSASLIFHTRLPQDRGWWFPGHLNVASAGLSSGANSAAGFTPCGRPQFDMQYGAVYVDNSGGVAPVTLTINLDVTFAVIMGDVANGVSERAAIDYRIAPALQRHGPSSTGADLTPIVAKSHEDLHGTLVKSIRQKGGEMLAAVTDKLRKSNRNSIGEVTVSKHVDNDTTQRDATRAIQVAGAAAGVGQAIHSGAAARMLSSLKAAGRFVFSAGEEAAETVGTYGRGVLAVASRAAPLAIL